MYYQGRKCLKQLWYRNGYVPSSRSQHELFRRKHDDDEDDRLSFSLVVSFSCSNNNMTGTSVIYIESSWEKRREVAKNTTMAPCFILVFESKPLDCFGFPILRSNPGTAGAKNKAMRRRNKGRDMRNAACDAALFLATTSNEDCRELITVCVRTTTKCSSDDGYYGKNFCQLISMHSTRRKKRGQSNLISTKAKNVH